MEKKISPYRKLKEKISKLEDEIRERILHCRTLALNKPDVETRALKERYIMNTQLEEMVVMGTREEQKRFEAKGIVPLIRGKKNEGVKYTNLDMESVNDIDLDVKNTLEMVPENDNNGFIYVRFNLNENDVNILSTYKGKSENISKAIIGIMEKDETMYHIIETSIVNHITRSDEACRGFIDYLKGAINYETEKIKNNQKNGK